MAQALYRKYRPIDFNSVVAQTNVKRILTNAIENNSLYHAYLFSGSRGIGKTTIARIFAKAVNCTDFEKNHDVCHKCDNCIEIDNNSVDIIELDAASNNGIDQIRDLKSRANIVPTKLKYKVYIIDEVHRLTGAAFDALLKTLEEPPAHVIFILATTEFYEVPETIISRCQCYSFDRLKVNEIVDRLKFIAKEENITVEEPVYEEIAVLSQGGMRDSIGTLEKLSTFSNKNITMDTFISVNGLVSHNDIKLTYESLINKDPKVVIDMVDKIYESGYSFSKFVEMLMVYIKDKIVNYYINKEEIDVNYNIRMVEKLNDLLNLLKTSLNPLVMTEVTLLGLFNDEVEIKETKKESKRLSNEEVLKKITVETKEPVAELTNVNEEARQIRMYNAILEADATKNKIVEAFSKLDEYILDKDYAKLVQMLKNSNIGMVSPEYVCIYTTSESNYNRLYDKFEDVENFINKLSDLKQKLVIITKEEFEEARRNYPEIKKNGKKKEDNLDIILNKKEKTKIENKLDSLGDLDDLIKVE